MIYDLQKATMWKRISAWLFDTILLAIVAVLCAWLVSVVSGFDGYNAALDERYDYYAAEYNVDFNMTYAEYEAMTEEQAAALQAAYDALGQDEAAVYNYRMVIQLTVVITSLGILAAYLIMEYLIPMLFKNGQTLGKKIFGLGVMRTEGIKVNGICLFIRTVLGKYTVETMIPVFILIMIYWGRMGLMGTLVLLALLIGQAIAVIVTKTNSPIHDLLAGTVVIDVASQMIFNTQEEMIAYKQKVHAEKVARQPY